MAAPSGEQFALRRGDLSAVVTEVGATLRELNVGTEAVCRGFAVEEICPGGMGQVLAPWPNRLEDGTYTFDGRSARAALDEPERHNAIHGLVRWLRFACQERSADAATLACALPPQPAYPFALGLEITYQLSDTGLEVRTVARNEDVGPIPFGIGFHPYFAAGPDGVDAAALVLPAARHLRLDDRGLPRRVEPVPARLAGLVAPDATASAPLGDLVLDDCFTDLERSADGRFAVEFAPIAGGARTLRVLGDEHFSHVMCFTGDTLAPGERRRAVAIEPMTCAPNALRDGATIAVIEPGQTLTAVWSVELT